MQRPIRFEISVFASSTSAPSGSQSAILIASVVTRISRRRHRQIAASSA
jgi:hypothetical protein